jgi:hypothetical protein
MRLKVPSLKCTMMCGSDSGADSDASANPDPDPDPDTACTLYSLTVPRLGSIVSLSAGGTDIEGSTKG